MRTSQIRRDTAETQIMVSINLDGAGKADVDTGIGFFDHMLSQIARHGLFDITVKAAGDLHIDAHHTVEDVGIVLGKAFLEALGGCQGITRYGHAVIPMDEVLAEVAVDFSGRPCLVFQAELGHGVLNGFDAELAEEFFRAFAVNARGTVHVILRYGGNLHHCIEGLFKAFARALDAASRIDPRISGVLSTKGMLEI